VGFDAEWREQIPLHLPFGIFTTPADPAFDPATDGWILCIAISEQAKELWIFDAADLARGPLCRLAHPRWSASNWGWRSSTPAGWRPPLQRSPRCCGRTRTTPWPRSFCGAAARAEG